MILKISERIKELRESKNLTQADLAKHIGVSRSSVNSWEMGLSLPTIDRLIDLAQLFHVSTDYLLGLKDENKLSIGSLDKEQVDVINRLIYYFDSHNPD
ncbi:MAG: helix-turn-helix transcriptional regulator [Lachnospiraceae bacterium]|nr:helix-turn-helix transcriptional regulator [Lachnospiraceae bacterium]